MITLMEEPCDKTHGGYIMITLTDATVETLIEESDDNAHGGDM